MHAENRYLQIEGIVSRTVLQKLVNRKYSKPNAEWFFVDYAPISFKKGIIFDIILEGEEKKILPRIYHIKLLDVLDQFGNHLEEIPEGWKTICRFEFEPKIPGKLYNLPKLNEWRYNKNSLNIARHEDLHVNTQPGKNAYATVIEDLFYFANHSYSIDRKQFMTDILKIYEEHKDEMNEKMPSAIFEEVREQMTKM